jgi:uncharacterized membrane protein
MAEQESEQMSGQTPSDVTSNDKVWAGLAYVFPVIVPLIIMLMDDIKERPFVKAHHMQALVWGVALYIISAVLSFTVVLACLSFVFYLVSVYWGYKAYQGETFDIPVITDFVKSQGWA